MQHAECAENVREHKILQEEIHMDYKKAGVDIEAGYKSVELMKEHVKKTMREEVLGGLGGFSGAFSLARSKIWRSRSFFPVLTDVEQR